MRYGAGGARPPQPITARALAFGGTRAVGIAMAAVTSSAWAGTLGGAMCGAAFLGWMAGVALLDPTNIEWLMKLDWVPHYFGWYYFRTEPWHWPPGVITGYYAP